MGDYGYETCSECGGPLIWQTDDIPELDGAVYVCDGQKGTSELRTGENELRGRRTW